MKKRIYLCILAAFLCLTLAGCQKADPEAADGTAKAPETVELLVWGAAEDEALLGQIFESFEQKYQSEADFHITFSPQSESNCMDALMNDLENGADVFAFADDQLNTLVAAGALGACRAGGFHQSRQSFGGRSRRLCGGYAVCLSSDCG